MRKIIELTESDVVGLVNTIQHHDKHGGIRKIRVTVEGDTVKFKINGGVWSPPLGTLDPECQEYRMRYGTEDDPTGHAAMEAKLGQDPYNPRVIEGLPEFAVPVAWDRKETEPCEKGTVGCSVHHPVGPETDCETW